VGEGSTRLPEANEQGFNAGVFSEKEARPPESRDGRKSRDAKIKESSTGTSGAPSLSVKKFSKKNGGELKTALV